MRMPALVSLIKRHRELDAHGIRRHFSDIVLVIGAAVGKRPHDAHSPLIASPPFLADTDLEADTRFGGSTRSRVAHLFDGKHRQAETSGNEHVVQEVVGSTETEQDETFALVRSRNGPFLLILEFKVSKVLHFRNSQVQGYVRSNTATDLGIRIERNAVAINSHALVSGRMILVAKILETHAQCEIQKETVMRVRLRNGERRRSKDAQGENELFHISSL